MIYPLSPNMSIEITLLRLSMTIVSILMIVLSFLFLDFLRLWRKLQPLLSLQRRIAEDTIKHKILFEQRNET